MHSHRDPTMEFMFKHLPKAVAGVFVLVALLFVWGIGSSIYFGLTHTCVKEGNIIVHDYHTGSDGRVHPTYVTWGCIEWKKD